MGKPRIRGSHAVIKVGSTEVGEISKFSVKELGEIKKSRAIGDPGVTANKTFEGYDLSFEGGKVDWNLASLMHQQDLKIYGGTGKGETAAPFKVVQTITYYGGAVETFTYDGVIIYGYNLDIDANDEMTEKFEGFCGTIRQITGNSVDPEESKKKSEIEQLIEAKLKASYNLP